MLTTNITLKKELTQEPDEEELAIENPKKAKEM